ncbi:hypothetical protein [Halosegnis marinus]|uniref:Uncharacterized protein n=1 Tax=Halosegnis marinus TaxID=3034023 RepID=A0ABD5ZR79_9EURY|nr:hypothetical protein [Halosegnis sp. DT85]
MERDSVLIYDGRRRLFRAVARAVGSRLDSVRVVGWQTDAAQRFLDAQFDARPFAFLLVDDEEVHAGGRTLARLLRDHGAGDRLAARVERLYGRAAGPMGRLLHGQEPADLDGSFRLTEEARGLLPRLRGQGTAIPVRESDGDGAGDSLPD